MSRLCPLCWMTGTLCLLLSFAGCTYDPALDGLVCGYGGICPPGTLCRENRCQPEDQLLDSGVTDSGDPSDGDDGGPDVADSEADGADAWDAGPGGEDGGTDEFPDAGGDPGTCSHDCPPGQFCSPADDQCYPCETYEHCGPLCFACGPDSQCLEMSGVFCCIPDCSLDNLCQQTGCGATLYTCAADISAQTANWYPHDQVTARACRWTTIPGPLPDSCLDANLLRYRCPWDGLCREGFCHWDETIMNQHDCGAEWGCDPVANRCRRHRPEGRPCQYNYDCESFCCSREEVASCIPFDPELCKIFGGHIENFFHLFWAFDEADPHNMDAWHNVPDFDPELIPHCDNDWDCDSGLCTRDFMVDVCTFQPCVQGPGEADIRATYFCAGGDQQAHIDAVTNPNAMPPPGSCP